MRCKWYGSWLKVMDVFEPGQFEMCSETLLKQPYESYIMELLVVICIYHSQFLIDRRGWHFIVGHLLIKVQRKQFLDLIYVSFHYSSLIQC